MCLFKPPSNPRDWQLLGREGEAERSRWVHFSQVLKNVTPKLMTSLRKPKKTRYRKCPTHSQSLRILSLQTLINRIASAISTNESHIDFNPKCRGWDFLRHPFYIHPVTTACKKVFKTLRMLNFERAPLSSSIDNFNCMFFTHPLCTLNSIS